MHIKPFPSFLDLKRVHIKSFPSFLDLKRVFSTHHVELPSQADVDGAVAAILRLQRVYNLSTPQIYAGNYSGYTGPALSPLVAYVVGGRAFSDGHLEQSRQWLQLAVDKMQLAAEPEMTSMPEDNGVYTSQEKAAAIALLGRVHIYVKYQKLFQDQITFGFKTTW